MTDKKDEKEKGQKREIVDIKKALKEAAKTKDQWNQGKKWKTQLVKKPFTRLRSKYWTG